MKKHFVQTLAVFAIAFGLTGLALFAGVQIWRITRDTNAAADIYSGIAQQAAAVSSVSGESTADPLARKFDWPALQAQYPGIVGWLSCPDTAIDYPIMQAEDNDHYLTHLADGTENNHGSLFLDAACDANFADWHGLVYGHNMKDGSMFHSLKSYAEQAYGDAHPALYLYTPDKTYTLAVFSAYATQADDETAYQQAGGSVAQAQWLAAVSRRSAITTSAQPQSWESFLTLSTCTNGEENERFVVHTVLR